MFRSRGRTAVVHDPVDDRGRGVFHSHVQRRVPQRVLRSQDTINPDSDFVLWTKSSKSLMMSPFRLEAIACEQCENPLCDVSLTGKRPEIRV